MYGLDLGGLRTGEIGPRRCAALAVNLPPGSMVWRQTGGPLAWTDEMVLLAHVDHGLRVLAWMDTEDGRNGWNVPKPLEPPRPAREVAAESDAIARRAARWKARQGTE